MVPSFLLRSYLMYAAYIIILLWIPSVRLQCSSTAVLRVACSADSIRSVHNHLANDPEPVTISACHQSTGWSLSPDGDSESVLDTSLAKYTVDRRGLTISNINGTDEGLYRCVYDTGATIRIACIYVYGRAIFASCPSGISASCASNLTSLSVEDGGDVSFDATVIHTPGGSCGFQQEITHVRLKKLNPAFGVDDDQLLSCATSKVSCGDSRVSLSRGNDPGYEFVFTLTGANISDSGMYKVEVEVVHPGTGSASDKNLIIKMFHLNVTARSSSRPLTTNPVDTATPTSMANMFTDGSSSVAILSTATSHSNRQDNLSIVIPIAVVVPVAIAALVLAVIGIGYMTIKTIRKQKLSVEKSSEKEQSQVRIVEHDGPPVEETGDMVLRMHLNGATQNDTNTVTELPPSNNRISLIEQDSGIFSHLNSTDSPAANV